MDKINAIYELNPTIVTLQGDIAYDKDGNQVSYDADAVQAKVDAEAYKSQRASEYPSIGDQLDALFHAGVFPTDMAAKIQAIKNKYPKGE